MKRWRISGGSRGVPSAPGWSSILAAIRLGPPWSKRRSISCSKCFSSRDPFALDTGAARDRHDVSGALGGARLLAGDLVDAVVHDDDGQVAWLQHPDGGQAAERHQDRSVAFQRDDAALGLRQRDAERDRTGKPHAAEHVEILRPVADRIEIEIGIADAGDDGLVRASLATSRLVRSFRLSGFGMVGSC